MTARELAMVHVALSSGAVDPKACEASRLPNVDTMAELPALLRMNRKTFDAELAAAASRTWVLVRPLGGPWAWGSRHGHVLAVPAVYVPCVPQPPNGLRCLRCLRCSRLVAAPLTKRPVSSVSTASSVSSVSRFHPGPLAASHSSRKTLGRGDNAAAGLRAGAGGLVPPHRSEGQCADAVRATAGRSGGGARPSGRSRYQEERTNP